jgi:hypothetical protein
MLKCFLELGADASLFEGLEISGYTKLCQKHLGKYPVISLTLKNVEGSTFEDAFEAMCEAIETLAIQCTYLLESSRLTQRQKEKFQDILTLGNRTYSSTKKRQLISSLKNLSDWLYQHHQKKVIILIDEYDVPLDKAFYGRYYDEMVQLVRGMLGEALKSNESLQFAVLTGCLRISKESIFTGLNNLMVHSISDEPSARYFGFTDQEVKDLLTYYRVNHHYHQVKEWYNGYEFGQTSIYCPWDVICYTSKAIKMERCDPESFWNNTSQNQIIKVLLEKADGEVISQITDLINGKSVRKELQENLTYAELESSVENLWSALYATGYLTKRGDVQHGMYELVIPNHEIRDLYLTKIKEWIPDTVQTNVVLLQHIVQAFQTGQAEEIEQIFQEYLSAMISIRDTAVRSCHKENFYHGILLGILKSAHNWDVKSNRESGTGYSDIQIQDRKSKIGILIEIKYAPSENLDECCRKALQQIREKEYDTELSESGMQKIFNYAIAFYKKSCKVMVEKKE